MTFYKLTTIRPCPTDVFLEFVQSRGAVAADDGTSNPLEFADETGSIYRIKFNDDRTAGYVSLDGTVIPAPERNGVAFGHVSRFIAFVAKNDLGLRRNGVEQPAHDGFLLSDIHHCEAYRQAEHAAMHPKDQS
ncbi:hypothetical protein [Rubripirellula tenax]|uniref:hypothetical protein n=1 Tax=Rubripirellula tenax TaxID=2528015 RepID=UPI0011B3C1AD|nr:hypothetical protein [Rubripirellula tenax]